MVEKAYGKTEIVGTSAKGFQDAIEVAVSQARKKWQGLAWFEVTEMRGNLAGTALEYQVTLKVGYRIIEE